MLERAAQLTLAEDHEARIGHVAQHERRGVDQVPLTLVGHQRADVADDRRVRRQPERRVHAGRLDVRDALDVDAFVHRHDLRGRDAVGAQDARNRVGGGDERPTCRYFHFENEFVLRWKSTRRDATSGGTGCAVDIDSASAAIETACGSCAWTMSGRSRLQQPRQLPAGLQIQLVAGRERDEVESLRRAPAQLARPGARRACARWPAARRPITVSSTWFCPPRQVVAVSM